ncbi:MAG: transposase [Kofleriaceae bacterium]|jgi:REP element-mobilizing transposase RayT|nr:transposase [Kofleriaceae bacterium]
MFSPAARPRSDRRRRAVPAGAQVSFDDLVRGITTPPRRPRRRRRGRPPLQHRNSVKRCRRPRFARTTVHHVSLRTVDTLPRLRTRAGLEVLERALTGARDHTRVTGFRVLHYALEGNHLHLIVEADDDTALSRGMKGLAIRLARGWNKAFARRGRVFADRYHARPVTSPTQMRNTLRYVLFNHVSHSIRDWQANRGQLRQRLRFFEPDRWSSGRWFDNGQSPPLGGARPVSGPTTWLAREGWLRAGGPIDPAELLDRRPPRPPRAR